MVVELEKMSTQPERIKGALHENPRILFQVMENLPVGVIVVDADGRPCYENMISRELLGTTVAISPEVNVCQLPEICQFYLAGTDQLYPENQTPLALALAGESVITEDVEIRRCDKTIPLEVYARPIVDQNGKVVYAVATFRDITRRKKNENKLREYAKEIQKLSENLSNRLVQKIGQMDNLSMIRDKLRKSPDLSSALNLILETALNDLGLDVGAVLDVDNGQNVLRLRGSKTRTKGIELDETYSLNSEFVEFEAFRKRETVSKVVGQSELSLLGTASVHCAPMYLGKNVHGIIVFGSEKGAVLDSSDQTVLGLYATLASTVFETQNLVITPVKETTRKIKKEFILEPGLLYLVKNDVEKAFEIFADNVLAGSEGLCITRQFPPRVRKNHCLEKTPIVWLTDEKVGEHITIHSLQDLSVLIGNFLDKSSHSIMLLDGFEYLVTNNGFDSFLRFLQLTRGRFEAKESILIAPLLERTLDTKQMKLIEREMTTIR